MKKEKKGSGISLGRIWSQYSFIFVLVIIMIGYAFTIQANGNTFNFGHIAAILSSQNTVIVGTIALGMAFVIITGQIDLSVGSNEKSARLAGINVTWVKISVFILTGLCVGVASLLQACKISNVTPASSGVSYEMYAIASVVLAGVNMAGGKGKLLGVIFGALSYTTINFIIVSIPGLSVDIQDTFQGLVLIIVILIQTVGPVIRENLQRAKKRRQAAAAEKA